MDAWDISSGEAPEDFQDLLMEDDGDLPDEQIEIEYLEIEEDLPVDEESQPMTLVGVYDEHGNAVPLVGVYDEHGNAVPMNIFYQSPEVPASPQAPASPVLVSPQTPASARPCDVDLVGGSESENGSALGDVVVKDDYDLADEHEMFEPVVQLTTSTQPVRAGRTRTREQGRRSRRPMGWVRGDRLTEVFLNDDDVPDDLREQVMKVIAVREARTRARTAANRRREDDDEFVDADDGGDEALLAGNGKSSVFEWSSLDTFQGKREPFLPQQTGPTVASESAYGAFRQYWDDSILSHIVTETNRYAEEVAASSNSFAQDWYATNVHEILILFSFWMMLGILRMPSTKSCFTLNPLLKTNVFRTMFSRTRYTNLCRALNFADNTNRPTDDSNRLFCFGPVLDHLNSRFQGAYVPSQNICIDESLTLWKGNLSFRQYIKTKAARFGVKTFELCESATGYMWSFFVYTGITTSYDPSFPSSLLKSTATVLKLVRPLLDKGYTLFMDNWFNSPLLARFLKSRRTDCVGTLRGNRRNVPPLMSLCNLKEGQFTGRHSGDVCILACQDKKKILTISTFHGNSQNLTEKKPHRALQYKLQIILDYNKGMGGVDRKDQMLEPYLLERKRCAKWNMKLFKRLLNCSILNSRIHLHASTATFKEHIVFRLELVEQILQRHREHVPKKVSAGNLKSISRASRITDNKHWPQLITKRLEGDSDRTARRRCTYCAKHNQRRQTTYICTECDVPLCIDPCFKLYHINS